MSEVEQPTRNIGLRYPHLVQLLEAEIRRLEPIDLIEWSRARGDPVLFDVRLGIDYLPGYHPDD